MALVVLLPEVPPIAMVFLVAAICASSSDLRITGIFNALAFCTSGTVSSTAVDTTITSVSAVIPSPFCKKHVIPAASSFTLISSNACVSKPRSDPDTCLPVPTRYCASALMPVPPTPIKKKLLELLMSMLMIINGIALKIKKNAAI